ncbi:hypothetical protein GCM10027277_15030 [Pseudoduganella ginsengisoli]|nr:hypothetical protein [Pseudoduganella ginsengisoli]
MYVDVLWLHTDDERPVRIVSELDAHRYEVRKLEFFRTRGVGYAEADFAFGSTELDAAPVPELERINADPQRHGAVISAEEFAVLWDQYTRG